MVKKQQETNKETITINLENKVVILKSTPFDTDIDMDDFVNIQHHNVIGEILTFPVVMNRIGNLKAEIDEMVKAEKLELEILKAELSEKYRKSNAEEATDSKGKPKIKTPTQAEVDNCVLMNKAYKVKKRNLITLEKNADIVNSWYWAAKDKSDNLKIVAQNLKPDDFENDIIEGAINGVMVSNHEKLIKK